MKRDIIIPLVLFLRDSIKTDMARRYYHRDLWTEKDAETLIYNHSLFKHICKTIR